MNTSTLLHIRVYTPATVNPSMNFNWSSFHRLQNPAYQTDIKKFLDHNSLTMDELLANESRTDILRSSSVTGI